MRDGQSERLSGYARNIDDRLQEEQKNLRGTRRTIAGPYWRERLHDLNQFSTKALLETLGNIEALKAKKQANIEEAKANMPAVEAEAYRYAEEWERYAKTQAVLMKEFGAEPVVGDINAFIATRDDVSGYYVDERGDDGWKKHLIVDGHEPEIAAAQDFLAPRVGKAVEYKGEKVRGYSRLARMDLGTDLADAIKKAE